MITEDVHGGVTTQARRLVRKHPSMMDSLTKHVARGEGDKHVLDREIALVECERHTV